MLIMDSGLGGISVVRALRAMAPLQPLSYLADTAGFPYGNRSPEEITARAVTALEALGKIHEFSTVVLACNTLSTLSLAALRAHFSYRFVGTVPAIKVAASQSKTRRFTLLSTPNTAHSNYTRDLIQQFAQDCVVDRYGAPNLASIAEAFLLGEGLDDEALRVELAPSFFDDAKGKTDSIILGCTHYPLLGSALQKHAPWEVSWIDSSAAIAKQALLQAAQAGRSTSPARAYVTAEGDVARYTPIFSIEHFPETRALIC